MLQDQRLWLLVSLKLSGEATAEELEELEAYMCLAPDLLKKVEVLQAFWENPNKTYSAKAENTFNKHLQLIEAHTDAAISTSPVEELSELPIADNNSKRNYYKLGWGLVAATALLFWIFVSNREPSTLKQTNNTVTTRPGSKTYIDLPDGSKVWLNTDSKLTYNIDLESNTREVFLSGEAYFDIARDESRPFIIHTRTINLKVLGTAFNVRSYDSDKETETALVHGSVEVTLLNNPDKKIVLKPGEKLLVKNNAPVSDSLSNPVLKQNEDELPIAVLTNMHYYGEDSSVVETSWTKNQLIFDKENLEKIALKIERWFNVKVVIKDEDLKSVKYTGLFEEESLEEVLQALMVTGGFKYAIHDKEVVISR